MNICRNIRFENQSFLVAMLTILNHTIYQWYSTVWYGMVWYGMVWYGKVWCGMVEA